MELEPTESLEVEAMVKGSKANESDCSTELKGGAGESGKLEGAMAEIEVQGTEGEGTSFEGEIGNKVFEGKVSIIGARDKVVGDKELTKGLGDKVLEGKESVTGSSGKVVEDKELSKGIEGKGVLEVKESREMFPEGKV